MNSLITNTKITSDNYCIISSGSAFSYSSSSNIKIEIQGISFIFQFVTTTSETQRVDREIISPNELKLKVVNFNSIIPIGLTSPIEVATINSKKVFLFFTISSLNDLSPKNLFYTFFQEL